MMPLAFALAILAIGLGANRRTAVGVLAIVLLLCPLVCIFFLMQESQQVKKDIEDAVGDHRGH